MGLMDDMRQAEIESLMVKQGSEQSVPGGLGTGTAGSSIMPTNPMEMLNRQIGMNPQQYLGEGGGLLGQPVDRQALKTRTDANGLPQAAYKQRGPLMGE